MIFKRDGVRVSQKTIGREEKLLHLCNSLNGTNYNLESVGIYKTTGIYVGEPVSVNAHFGHYTRTGESYSELKDKDYLKKRQLKALK